MGINSFGFAGAVAHAIFEEAPKPEAGSDIFGEALKAKGETNGEAGWNFGTGQGPETLNIFRLAQTLYALMTIFIPSFSQMSLATHDLSPSRPSPLPL
jgi:acyl transferase domain-containing protein